jgi:putative nucleotidyltransferase with HDIG domain
MNYNIEFQIAALAFAILITVHFFKNRREWTTDNKIFANLAIFTIFLTIDDIICPILLVTPEIDVGWKLFSGRLYLILMIQCMTSLVQYTICVSLNQETIRERLFIIIRIGAVVIALISLFLPLHYAGGKGAHIYGYAQDLLYIIGGLVVFFVLIYAILNRKKIPRNKIMPLYAYVVIEGLTTLIENQNKGILLTSISLVFVLFLIYFTLQDPKIKMIEERDRKLIQTINEMLFTLARSVDAKDHYTAGHSLRVAEYAKLIAQKLSYTPERQMMIYQAGLLHDVGKIGIPDAVLNKKDRLTYEEYLQIKNHTTIGADILKNTESFPEAENVAHYHHERFDGNGYPEMLKGYEIPESARITAIADTFDAMTLKRVYRENVYTKKEAIDEIKRCSGSQFDPQIAQVFIDAILAGEVDEIMKKYV